MQIVSDSGCDLSPEQLEGIEVHFAPLRITLDEVTYTNGVDITSQEFYELLSKTESCPTTSQPSAGEFADIYRRLAKTDPEIFSIHISSGLSGTLNAAKAGAQMVPEAKVTFFDTKTLSCPAGWQVEAAARAFKAGISKERVMTFLENIGAHSEGIFTLPTLKYLIHGGRISHLKGLMASLLNIKPVIGVEKQHGTYITLGQEITFKRAVNKLVNILQDWYQPGKALRIQLLHTNNLQGVEALGESLKNLFEITWLPVCTIAPVLGAHTGPGLVGMSVSPADIFNNKPW
jgi:DegV family protein with EDD domain